MLAAHQEHQANCETEVVVLLDLRHSDDLKVHLAHTVARWTTSAVEWDHRLYLADDRRSVVRQMVIVGQSHRQGQVLSSAFPHLGSALAEIASYPDHCCDHE